MNDTPCPSISKVFTKSICFKCTLNVFAFSLHKTHLLSVCIKLKHKASPSWSPSIETIAHHRRDKRVGNTPLPARIECAIAQSTKLAQRDRHTTTSSPQHPNTPGAPSKHSCCSRKIIMSVYVHNLLHLTTVSALTRMGLCPFWCA